MTASKDEKEKNETSSLVDLKKGSKCRQNASRSSSVAGKSVLGAVISNPINILSAAGKRVDVKRTRPDTTQSPDTWDQRTYYHSPSELIAGTPNDDVDVPSTEKSHVSRPGDCPNARDHVPYRGRRMLSDRTLEETIKASRRPPPESPRSPSPDSWDQRTYQYSPSAVITGTPDSSNEDVDPSQEIRSSLRTSNHSSVHDTLTYQRRRMLSDRTLERTIKAARPAIMVDSEEGACCSGREPQKSVSNAPETILEDLPGKCCSNESAPSSQPIAGNDSISPKASEAGSSCKRSCKESEYMSANSIAYSQGAKSSIISQTSETLSATSVCKENNPECERCVETIESVNPKTISQSALTEATGAPSSSPTNMSSCTTCKRLYQTIPPPCKACFIERNAAAKSSCRACVREERLRQNQQPATRSSSTTASDNSNSPCVQCLREKSAHTEAPHATIKPCSFEKDGTTSASSTTSKSPCGQCLREVSAHSSTSSPTAATQPCWAKQQQCKLPPTHECAGPTPVSTSATSTGKPSSSASGGTCPAAPTCAPHTSTSTRDVARTRSATRLTDSCPPPCSRKVSAEPTSAVPTSTMQPTSTGRTCLRTCPGSTLYDAAVLPCRRTCSKGSSVGPISTSTCGPTQSRQDASSSPSAGAGVEPTCKGTSATLPPTSICPKTGQTTATGTASTSSSKSTSEGTQADSFLRAPCSVHPSRPPTTTSKSSEPSDCGWMACRAGYPNRSGSTSTSVPGGASGAPCSTKSSQQPTTKPQTSTSTCKTTPTGTHAKGYCKPICPAESMPQSSSPQTSSQPVASKQPSHVAEKSTSDGIPDAVKACGAPCPRKSTESLSKPSKIPAQATSASQVDNTSGAPCSTNCSRPPTITKSKFSTSSSDSGVCKLPPCGTGQIIASLSSNSTAPAGTGGTETQLPSLMKSYSKSSVVSSQSGSCGTPICGTDPQVIQSQHGGCPPLTCGPGQPTSTSSKPTQPTTMPKSVSKSSEVPSKAVDCCKTGHSPSGREKPESSQVDNTCGVPCPGFSSQPVDCCKGVKSTPGYSSQQVDGRKAEKPTPGYSSHQVDCRKAEKSTPGYSSQQVDCRKATKSTPGYSSQQVDCRKAVKSTSDGSSQPVDCCKGVKPTSGYSSQQVDCHKAVKSTSGSSQPADCCKAAKSTSDRPNIMSSPGNVHIGSTCGTPCSAKCSQQPTLEKSVSKPSQSQQHCLKKSVSDFSQSVRDHASIPATGRMPLGSTEAPRPAKCSPTLLKSVSKSSDPASPTKPPQQQCVKKSGSSFSQNDPTSISARKRVPMGSTCECSQQSSLEKSVSKSSVPASPTKPLQQQCLKKSASSFSQNDPTSISARKRVPMGSTCECSQQPSLEKSVSKSSVPASPTKPLQEDCCKKSLSNFSQKSSERDSTSTLTPGRIPMGRRCGSPCAVKCLQPVTLMKTLSDSSESSTQPGLCGQSYCGAKPSASMGKSNSTSIPGGSHVDSTSRGSCSSKRSKEATLKTAITEFKERPFEPGFCGPKVCDPEQPKPHSPRFHRTPLRDGKSCPTKTSEQHNLKSSVSKSSAVSSKADPCRLSCDGKQSTKVNTPLPVGGTNTAHTSEGEQHASSSDCRLDCSGKSSQQATATQQQLQKSVSKPGSSASATDSKPVTCKPRSAQSKSGSITSDSTCNVCSTLNDLRKSILMSTPLDLQPETCKPCPAHLPLSFQSGSTSGGSSSCNTHTPQQPLHENSTASSCLKMSFTKEGEQGLTTEKEIGQSATCEPCQPQVSLSSNVTAPHVCLPCTPGGSAPTIAHERTSSTQHPVGGSSPVNKCQECLRTFTRGSERESTSLSQTIGAPALKEIAQPTSCEPCQPRPSLSSNATVSHSPSSGNICVPCTPGSSAPMTACDVALAARKNSAVDKCQECLRTSFRKGSERDSASSSHNINTIGQSTTCVPCQSGAPFSSNKASPQCASSGNVCVPCTPGGSTSSPQRPMHGSATAASCEECLRTSFEQSSATKKTETGKQNRKCNLLEIIQECKSPNDSDAHVENAINHMIDEGGPVAVDIREGTADCFYPCETNADLHAKPRPVEEDVGECCRPVANVNNHPHGKSTCPHLNCSIPTTTARPKSGRTSSSDCDEQHPSIETPVTSAKSSEEPEEDDGEEDDSDEEDSEEEDEVEVTSTPAPIVRKVGSANPKKGARSRSKVEKRPHPKVETRSRSKVEKKKSALKGIRRRTIDEAELPPTARPNARRSPNVRRTSKNSAYRNNRASSFRQQVRDYRDTCGRPHKRDLSPDAQERRLRGRINYRGMPHVAVRLTQGEYLRRQRIDEYRARLRARASKKKKPFRFH